MMTQTVAKEVFLLTNYDRNLKAADNLLKAGLVEESTFKAAENLIKQAQPLYNPLDDAKVGDGITVCGYSDRHAGTIIHRTAKTITLQVDKATLLNGDELEFHPGGFSAHCSNQNIQKYSYEADKGEQIIKVTRRANGKYIRVGSKTASSFAGRSKFHDYNF